jgi:hypothetical protein
MRGKKCKTGYILEKELSTSRGEPRCNSLDSGVPVVDSWTVIAGFLLVTAPTFAADVVVNGDGL